MINFKLIFKVLGQLMFLEAIMMLVCLGMALFYGEDDVMAFLISIAIVMLFGLLLNTPHVTVTRR